MLYRALFDSVRSLRGEPALAVAPTEPAVVYRARTARGIAPLADIYLPRSRSSFVRPPDDGASVLLVHGGAFVIGSRRMKPMRLLAARLSAAGIAVCAIDYRMMFRGGRLDDAVDDVCDAIAFWAARAPDPDRVTLVGLSAGASLGLLASARAGSNIARLACCFGLYEVDHLRGIATVFPRLLFATRDRAAWTARSPRHAPQPAIPTLLLHGTDDKLVPVEQAQRLAAHREALGLPTRLVTYEGAPHGFFNAPCTAADAAIAELVAFAR